ncbi:hypothetical protein FJU08_19730 [Martelella alba]|uniref:AlgX/AlgJ SGNH hydrolase-like domain-containing protein n=1 Tax=Martelella alba TaxID=2590451 RepID=A0A506U2H5_9HYPH|nr:hypothetical protein [Martelella alba]TPW27668.1 hypothetical protein FJU08_19730 [Martelella alba]
MENRTMRKLALAVLLFVAGNAAARAETTVPETGFGCTGLQTLASPKTIEGKDGFFFSVDDDIRMPMTGDPQMVASIAALSKQLAARGTTLVYVPVPTKGQVMSDLLPDAAFALGFEADISDKLYETFVARLQTAGVAAVDLLQPLRAAGTADPAFYRSAEYWSDHGARIAAKAAANVVMARPAYGGIAHTAYETMMYGPVLRPSAMRNNLQAFCRENLPPVIGHVFETKPANMPADGDDTASPAVLVGTQYSLPEFSHFAGFIEEFSALRVENRAIAGADALAAMIDYVTSDAFITAPPPFLIWEAPVAGARSGAGPIGWNILLAAAGRECRPLAAANQPSGAPGLSVDMRKVADPGASVLMIRTGQAAFDHVDIRTTDGRGTERHLSISADGQLAANGNVFVPLRPVASDGLLDLSVVVAGGPDAPPALYLCNPPVAQTQ